MKRFIFSVVLSLMYTIIVFAQSQTFSDPNVEYTFELPEPLWKMVVKPSATSPNVEYVYRERSEGYLEIRKLAIKDGEIISDLIQRDKEQKLQFLPGYVAGKEENFAGNFRGRIFNYEFVRSGRNMTGRFYYLRADDSTVFVIRFTGLRDKLRLIRNQTDSIARTFDIKKETP